MASILALIQLLCIIIIMIYEYKRRSPMIFCWATLLLMFGIMHLLTSFFENYTYNEDVLNEASLFVTFFCIIYLFARSYFQMVFKSWILEKRVNDVDDSRVSNTILFLFFISVFIYIAFLFYQSGYLAGISKDDVYRAMSQKSILFIFSIYLYYSTSPILLYYMYKKRKWMCFLIGALIMIKTFFSMARMDMIAIFVSLIGVVILYPNRNMFKKIVLLSVIAIISIYGVYALRAYRYYDTIPSFFELNSRIVDFVKTENGILGLREGFYYFISKENSFAGFGTFDGYKRVFLLPIPSSLSLGLKPEDMCVTMGRALKPNVNVLIPYTFTPTLFGDCYANLGFLGCLLGFFWGGVATVLDIICNRRCEILKYLLYCMIAIQCVDIGRGSVYNSLCIIYYGSLFVYIYSLIGRKLTNTRIKLF